METKTRLVSIQHPHPYPLPQLEPRNQEEWKLFFESQLDVIDDLIDDSLRFIDEELSHISVAPRQAAESKERLRYGLLSVWAESKLARIREMVELETGMDAGFIDQYFEKKFARPLRTHWN